MPRDRAPFQGVFWIPLLAAVAWGLVLLPFWFW